MKKILGALILNAFAILFVVVGCFVALRINNALSADFSAHLARPEYKKSSSGECHKKGARAYDMVKTDFDGYDDLKSCKSGEDQRYICKQGKCSRK